MNKAERRQEIRAERDRIEREIRGVCSDGWHVIEGQSREEIIWWRDFLDTRIIFYEGQCLANQKRCQNSYHRRKNKKGKCPDCALKTFKL